LRWDGHRQLVEPQTTDHGIKKQNTTAFITKSRRHLMRTAFDFPKESLNDIVGANRLPMVFGKRIEGQACLQISLQAGNRRWVDALIFFDEGCDCLIRLVPGFLIKQRFSLRFHLLTLLLRHRTQDILHFVDDTTWSLGLHTFDTNPLSMIK